MTHATHRFSGVFAPVVTPFRNDLPDLDALRYNLRYLNTTQLKGYLALGSNGEYRSLSETEQLQVLEVFAEEKGEKLVMVGSGWESTHVTIERSNQVVSMGFEAISVLTPSYFAKLMNAEVLRGFYRRIADTVLLPMFLYNAPGFAGGVQISPDVVAELAQHPNIIGMKDSSPAGPARYLRVLTDAEDFAVLAGSANFFYPTLHIGASGGVLSLANIIPELCCELFTLFQNGSYNEAVRLHFRLSRVNEGVSGKWGVAGVKAAMDLLGLKGGDPRHPLPPLDEQARKNIRDVLLRENIVTE